jgi:hypothetical protein
MSVEQFVKSGWIGKIRWWEHCKIIVTIKIALNKNFKV